HFFYAAGDDMAKNIRGLLCSLIHQLLVGLGGLGEKVPVDEGRAISKPVDEWSDRQLREVLIWALRECDIPVVIFLDGIDEVDAGDGNAKLLDLIEIFCKTEGTKVCVSSRPGKPFKSRLLGKPTLNLEDVTRAKGVFLWAALTLKGLESGLCSGDSISQLEERLNLVEPGDVNALYVDTLKRLIDDGERHLKEAAILLNTVIAYLDLQHMAHTAEGPVPIVQLDLHLLTVALDKGLAAAMVNGDRKAEDVFVARREVLRVEIAQRCGGLLEVCSDDRNSVALIHDSAYEFL
ncbi:hypothetical protein B0T26DRAFT_609471, partial [Lasiosphaeria miniovina]